MKRCSKCGLEISFRRLANGKWCPQNVDGSDHWDICRETKNARLKDSGNLLMEIQSDWIKGNDIICDCPYNIPPWEPCGYCGDSPE